MGAGAAAPGVVEELLQGGIFELKLARNLGNLVDGEGTHPFEMHHDPVHRRQLRIAPRGSDDPVPSRASA